MFPLWLLCTGLLPGAIAPEPPTPLHSVAFVNDPRSHGQVGDNLLSLNEAIQLHNQTLFFTQLSVAEQLQISGFGQDVSWADLDAGLTPAIVMERDLDVIIDRPHGLLVSGFNGKVLIDFSPVTNGFVANSNSVNFRRLVLRGGPVAIHVTQTNATFGSFIDQVDFESQTVAALRCDMSTPGENGVLLVDGCTFDNVPVGIVVDERPADRFTDVFVGNSSFTNVQDGIRALLGPGGTALWEFEKLQVDAAGTGIQFQRSGAGVGRTVLFEALHLDVVGATALDFRGVPSIGASLLWRMLDLVATSGTGRALALGPLGADITGTLDEVVLSGNSELLSGATGALTVGNARMAGGSVTLGTTGAQLLLLDTIFDGVQTVTQGTASVTVRDSCLRGGTAQGGVGAPLVLDSCFVGAATGPRVTQSNPLPAPQLGSMSVVPRRPVLGGSITLQADLPPGLFGLWVMGATAVTPTIQPRPLHVYLDLGTAFTIPGIYRLQQTFQFPVPNVPSLLDSDWVVQMGVFRDPGTVAPPLSLPPGRRFVIR